MDHVAIMKKSWGLTGKILSREKTIETRWYKAKYAPWDRIFAGDTIYFKDSGDPVTVKAVVDAVEQFDDVDERKRNEILDKYGHRDLGTMHMKPEIEKYIKDKQYCIVVHLDNPQPVEPFDIDKSGYGVMSAWICVDDIDKIRK